MDYNNNANRIGFFKKLDPILLLSALSISILGLSAMSSFDTTKFIDKQLMWIGIAFVIFLLSSLFDYRFLRKGSIVLSIYLFAILGLVIMFFVGSAFQGAQSWLNLGFFAIQPSEFAKIALIIVLSKYFSKRHMDIASFRHILISGAYAFIIFFLILLQPDFGSAMIVAFIWFGILLTSGISKKHIAILFLTGAIAVMGAWQFVFQDYQKDRIISFVYPMRDIMGTGYNAYQSTIAVGSGGLTGKGIGYGMQSKLKFLPEYETDFIFASFAEEWGLIGVVLLFILFGIIIWRLLLMALVGATNFESLFIVGVASFIGSHFFVNIGMNIGILPVTGVTLPFMSYGGSHLVSEGLALGMAVAMNKYSKIVKKENVIENEFLGV